MLIDHPEKSAFYTTCTTRIGWRICRHAWEQLHHPLAAPDTTPCHPLKAGFFEGSLLEGPMPPIIWSSLPVQDHEIIPPSETFVHLFQEACTYLQNFYGDLTQEKMSFLKAIALIDLKAPYRGSHIRATSVSLPALPFCSFFSEKALHHIPPGLVLDHPEMRFLAENIYHEAIHQWVNLNLLERDLFRDDYNSQHSPKVEIPWRKDYDIRTRFWELDRVLHALSVYTELLPYRMKEAAHAPDHPHPQLALQKARTCTHFLSEALSSHQDRLTPLGRTYLQDLKNQAREWGVTGVA